jgi:hypothetical protein
LDFDISAKPNDRTGAFELLLLGASEMSADQN